MRRCFLLPVFLCASLYLAAQQGNETPYRILFWNLENYFDPFDDSLTADEDFTPTGSMYWSWEKFEKKRNHIYQLIVAAGNPDPPVLVGVAEAENYFVLRQLVSKTPLMKFDYGIIHKESPDRRGIDVALLYRKEQFRLISRTFYPVLLDENGRERTRDILHAFGSMGQDSLHIFVNHWPSRSGGQAASDEKRCRAARILRACIDSILLQNPEAKILVMGDFNDTPVDASLTVCLGAGSDYPVMQERGGANVKPPGKEESLINLAGILLKEKSGEGTHKFQGEWAMLDQMLVTPSLLKDSEGLRTKKELFRIFKADFLLVRDEQFFGMKPYRTLNGPRYEGGYSDHLPVLIELVSGPSHPPSGAGR